MNIINLEIYIYSEIRGKAAVVMGDSVVFDMRINAQTNVIPLFALSLSLSLLVYWLISQDTKLVFLSAVTLFLNVETL